MKITVRHILELIDTLEKNVPFDYVKAGGNKAILVNVDFVKSEINAKRILDDGNEQSVKFISANLELIENGIAENTPFSMDKVFSNGGNARSVIEALLARTPEFHACWIDRRKHLVWIPSMTHDAGSSSIIDEKDIPAAVPEKPESTQRASQKIYFGTPGSGKSNRVKKIVAPFEKDTFRTTFHPDSDYASFVGSYKPIMISESVVKQAGSLTEDQLAAILKEKCDKAGNTKVALTQFGIEFSGYFNGKIKSFSKEDIVIKAGMSSTYKTELHTAVNLTPWVEENNKSGVISYEFVPQAFTDAYVRAWQNNDAQVETPVYLVIEEINRGNCAQIFGDLFQLLDRGPDGKSEYPVKADKDLRRYLETVLGADHEGIKDGNLCLPANLHILATMNTSDQSLFPMDSAFKRRWDWEYVPIDPENPDSQFKITIGDKTYEWSQFLKAANEHIKDVSESEDKQMGNFFIKGDIGRKEFISKVMFYLWSEVCKEEYHARSFFRSKDTASGKETEFSFNELFEKDASGTCKDVALLQGFMNYLDVHEIGKE